VERYDETQPHLLKACDPVWIR